MPPILLLAGVLVLWQLVNGFFGIRAIVFPSPVEVIEAFQQNLGLLLRETAVTMAEAVTGFAVGTAIAYIAAISFTLSPPVRYALYPYMVALKTTPLIAIAPLLVLWFGNGVLSKMVMSALVSFFPVLVNAVTGLNSVDQETRDLMRALSASRWQMLRLIRIPGSMPYLLAGMKVGCSLALVGAIIGEFTGARQGIGYVINTASYYLETPLMCAAIITIAAGGIGFFGVVSWAESAYIQRFLPHQDEDAHF